MLKIKERARIKKIQQESRLTAKELDIKTKSDNIKNALDGAKEQFFADVVRSAGSSGSIPIGAAGNEENKSDSTSRPYADVPIPLPVLGIDPIKREGDAADRIRRIMNEAIRNGIERAILTYGRGLQERDLQVLRSINQYEFNVLGTVNQKLSSISTLPIQLP